MIIIQQSSNESWANYEKNIRNLNFLVTFGKIPLLFTTFWAALQPPVFDHKKHQNTTFTHLS